MPPYAKDRGTSLLIPANEEHFKDCRARIKCVLVGDGAVGKTSLVVSYTTNGYPTEYVPTAFDNYNVVVNVDSQPIRFQLCDTAGQDDFDSLRPLCYPNTDVFLLCFSVVSPTSFANVSDKWLPEIRKHCPEAPVILVGTQSDLRTDVKVLIELANYREQPVSELDARRLAHKINAECYIESSALTQKNLKEVFDQAILCSLRKNQDLHRLTIRQSKARRILSCWTLKPTRHHKDDKEKGKKQSPSYAAYPMNSRKPKKSVWKKLCCW